MPEKKEALKATPTIPVYAKLLLAAHVTYTLLLVGLMLAGAYLLYLDKSPPYTAERQAVIDRIEQFHEQHGRYPTYDEAQKFVGDDDPIHVRGYKVTAAGFQIGLVHYTLLPGERSWTYDSETKSWEYYSESW